MKYETPELTTLPPAVSTIQSGIGKFPHNVPDSMPGDLPEATAVYADWE
jgi:hypothetical protein